MPGVRENPYAAPARGHSPNPRPGWPTPLLLLVGLVSGLTLMAGPVALGIAVATPDRGSPHSASPVSPSRAPHRAPSSSPTGPPSAAGPLTIDFPDGARGTFTAPAGLQHEANEDEDGHVALAGEASNPPYLDVYTDRTSASMEGDLHAAAAHERRLASSAGVRTTSVSYFTYAGQDIAQFRMHQSETKDLDAYDALVTVVLVKHNLMALYWADDPAEFTLLDANADELAVVRSMDVEGGIDPTT
jgi:hypothetical protein